MGLFKKKYTVKEISIILVKSFLDVYRSILSDLEKLHSQGIEFSDNYKEETGSLIYSALLLCFSMIDNKEIRNKVHDGFIENANFPIELYNLFEDRKKDYYSCLMIENNTKRMLSLGNVFAANTGNADDPLVVSSATSYFVNYKKFFESIIRDSKIILNE